MNITTQITYNGEGGWVTTLPGQCGDNDVILWLHCPVPFTLDWRFAFGCIGISEGCGACALSTATGTCSPFFQEGVMIVISESECCFAGGQISYTVTE
jgi:hypothetical protein